MTDQLAGLLLLVALPLCFTLNGYWLAAPLQRETPWERIAVAMAGGLGAVLVALGALAFFHPISGPWVAVCFAPILPTLLLKSVRENLVRDAAGTVRACPVMIWFAGVAFFAVLLLALFSTPGVLYFDGSANHDGFLWIARADYLLRHGFMEAPKFSATQPFASTGLAIFGWAPVNGRIGAEGLLALVASITGKPPLTVYFFVSASLAVAWWAAVFLTCRTFISETISLPAGVALIALEPVFLFFHANANLPNLLGVLTGTTMIVAVERALRSAADTGKSFAAWSAIAGLSFGGMLCAYPEIAPFALIPCGLLLARALFGKSRGAPRSACVFVICALLAGAALNPVTTIRAYNGFLASVELARVSNHWFDPFSRLNLAEQIPAAVTLSFVGAKELGWIVGTVVSVTILFAVCLVIRHARDRFGLLAAFSGLLVLWCYTMATDFSYGLQKAVQFSAIAVAAVFPVGSIEILSRLWFDPAQRLRRAVITLGGVIVFTAYSSVMSFGDLYKWSHRKVISADWFDLLEASRSALRDAPVEVDASTFRYDFFRGMWATYFLQDSHIYFGDRDKRAGGYLEDVTISARNHNAPAPAAVLVGREWADSFDFNSPRILVGHEYALLATCNRVFAFEGVTPVTGVPEWAGPRIFIDILPHSASVLEFTIIPSRLDGVPKGTWQSTRQTEGEPDVVRTFSESQISIPLVPGKRNRIEIHFEGPEVGPGSFPFLVQGLRIANPP